MLRNSAWMLILAVIVLLTGVVGCASDKPSRSTRNDSPYASGASSAPSGASCH
jgi:hypothetical protein